MANGRFRKVISVFLSILMVVTMLPVTAIAEEIENIGCTHHPFHNDECGYKEAKEEIPCGHICNEECGEACAHEHGAECGFEEAVPASECNFRCEICEADVIYSDEEIFLNGTFTALEESGKNDFVLMRASGMKKLSATLLVYDYSANYGKDYTVYVNGEAVVPEEGSKSIFDIFAESGENISAKETDLAATMEQVYSEEREDIKASDMFAELDALGVCAARIPLLFDFGETEIKITFEISDDNESEYDETLMIAVLDGKGEVSRTAQNMLTIVDNEEDPETKISFDCAEELAMGENGVAVIEFRREGNLATNSLATLFHDGEPLGYVDFAPYQTKQTVEAAFAGIYTLGDENGNITDSAKVTVYDPLADSYNVPEGADPELDKIPDSYATIADNLQKPAGWFPEWAQTSGYRETETQKIFVGNGTDDSIFEQESNSSKGSTSWFPNGDNNVGVNTSGGLSHVSSGTNKIKSKYFYDLKGIESIYTEGSLSGVDKNAKIGMEVDECTGWHETVESSGIYGMTATVPLGYRSSSYIHIYNRDPQTTGGGTNFWVINGFVLNKRPHYFEIRGDLSDSIDYYGAESTKPIIEGNNDLIKVYMSDNPEAYSKVDIIYNYDNKYPAKLIGYKLRNGKTGKVLDFMIDLEEGAGFYFTKAFIDRYEKTYMWPGDVNGDGAAEAVYTIIPVYEKIPVDYEIKDAKGGSIVLKNPEKALYMGDYAVFGNAEESELNLHGVYYEAYIDGMPGIQHSATEYADSDGLVRVQMSSQYTKYVFKGVYAADSDNLSVYYAEENPKGTIDGGEGVKISSGNYVKNEYVTLMAKADPGYITKWIVDTEVYYGNVYYHRLNGNPDSNKILVSFVQESGLKTADINGIVNSSYVNLLTKSNTPSPVEGVTVTVTGETNYSATTGATGNYSISSFKGVPGGRYTALVSYDAGFAYATITFDESTSYILTVPQFAEGDCYPISATASLAGGDSSVNIIPLEMGQFVKIRVAVQGKANSVPNKVNVIFCDTMNGLAETQTFSIYSPTESIGDVSYWDIKLSTDEIPYHSRLFTSVEYEKTILSQDSTTGEPEAETTPAVSDKVDCGYEFGMDYEDSTIPVQYDVPDTPSATEGEDVFAEALHIPILGGADFKISSTTGGFFVTRYDPDTGCSYMMCGYSFEGLYAKGSLSSKYNSAKESREEAKKHSIGKRTSGSNDAEMVPVDVGAGEGTGDPQTQAGKQSNWTFAPAFMFMMTAKPGEVNTDKNYVSAYEIIVGFDLWFFKNFPFNFYGLPMYVSVSFGVEAVIEMAVNMKEESVELGSTKVKDIFNNLSGYPQEGDIDTIEGIIGASKLDVSVKGGVGVNNFLGVFISGTARIPILFQLFPTFEVGGRIGFDISAGADIVMFTGALEVSVLDTYYGDNEDDDDNGDGVVDEKDADVVGELKTIHGTANSRQSDFSRGENVKIINSPAEFDFEKELNGMLFKVMERNTEPLRETDTTVVSNDNFKNTGVHLWKLGNGNLVAAYLKDNGAEGTLNYLSAVCSISEDGGRTWGDEVYFSDNTEYPGTSLQYDVNLFELEDRALVTWSEADFDTLISEMNIDVNNITAAQVAKLMGAMNLCGIFVDKEDGSIIGEPFTIAENSTVACGVIDAVQHGENVYVYYQRNAIPEKGELSFTEFTALERTVAMARTSTENPEEWVSSPVRVENENGQQYRITGVEPFEHDGIFGEIIVLDRDGKISVRKTGGNWENSDDDRMLILRVYDFNPETGEPEVKAITYLTDADTCAQNPQVVSNGKELYLFYNENGDIVYLKDFVANEDDDEETVRYSAFIVRNSDGTFTVNNSGSGEWEATGQHIANHSSIHYGTKFSATMDENGDIMLCWIADEQKEGVALATEEIYGIMLREVTNAKAFELMGISESLESEEANQERLWAAGKPVAITDENVLIGALDGIGTDAEKGEFILGYTRLNSNIRTNVTSADVKVVSDSGEPDMVINEILFEEYPTPGSETVLQIEIENRGFRPLNGGTLVVSAFGKDETVDIEKTIWPGTGENFMVTINVPEDFSKDETVNVNISGKGEQAGYVGRESIVMKYGPYFTVNDVWQTSIAGTKDVNVKVTVTNIGNAKGIPEITAKNSIGGTEDDAKEYAFSGDNEILPGGSGIVEYVLEDTYINEEQTAQVAVRTGESPDQYIKEFMPKPLAVMPASEDEEEKPEDVHEHLWGEWETVGNKRIRRCSACKEEEVVYVIGPGKAEDEHNPETGATIIIFGKSIQSYIEPQKVSERKRRR